MIDGLLHCAVDDIAASPPATPIEGSAWLIAAGASGEWDGRSGEIALRQNGQWLFAPPRDGMRVLNEATGQDLRRINAAWVAVSAPEPAAGGTVVDAEARATLDALIAALRLAGIFAQ